MTATACGPGWHVPRSGRRVFTVSNSTHIAYEVELVSADELLTYVYGEIEILAPGTSRPMDVVLPPGRYSFQCESFTGALRYSAVGTVVGPEVAGAHRYLPVSYEQVEAATLDYRASLRPVMSDLVAATGKLAAAVDAGKLRLARSLWLPAHLDYARLGAAYDTFANFNAEIDGRPDGLPGGVNSRRFTGFLRLEYGLWHRQPASELRGVVVKLERDVKRLRAAFPFLPTPINDVALRTHEILENTLQFELTGETDEGSHTNLATAFANAEGTELAFDAIAPLIRLHAPAVARGLEHAIVGFAHLLARYRHRDGSWTALEALTRSDREKLDGTLSGLLERLEVVPDLLEIPVQPAALSGS